MTATAWRYFSSDSQRAIQVASEQFKNDPRHLDTMRYLPQRLQRSRTLIWSRRTSIV
jgi:hypothetical protein